MDAETYPNRTLARWINRHVVPVRVSNDLQAPLAEKYSVHAVPAFLFIESASGEELLRFVGFQRPATFLDTLRRGRKTLRKMKVLAETLKENVNDFGACFELCELQITWDQRDKARENLERARQEVPAGDTLSSARVHFLEGLLAAVEQRTAQARKAFEGAQGLDPDDRLGRRAAMWLALARLEMLRCDYGAAKTLLDNLGQIRSDGPELPEWLYYLGLCHRKLGQSEEARKRWKELLDLPSRNPWRERARDALNLPESE